MVPAGTRASSLPSQRRFGYGRPMQPLRSRWPAGLSGLVVLLAAATTLAAPAAEDWKYEAHLITVGAGSSLVERLGHSWLTVGRVRPGRLENVVYDLGRPESDASLLDFLGGRTTSRVLRAGTVTRALQPFMAGNRRVEEQRLALRPSELKRLRDALVAEQQPDRQTYTPHPRGETSATRARDLLDRATGGALRRLCGGWGSAAWGAPGKGLGSSARELLRQELAGRPDGELVLDLFGGRTLDRRLDAYEALFLPRLLRQVLTEVKRDGAPLADAPRPVHRGQPLSREVLRPASKLGWTWSAALVVLGLIGLWRLPGSRLAGVALLAGPVTLGAIGVVLLLAALRASTPEARFNELLLSFLATDLLLLPVAWRWLRGRASAGKPLLGYAIARVSLTVLVLVGHATGLLYQQPRALLWPGLIASILLLGLVLRVRATRRELPSAER